MDERKFEKFSLLSYCWVEGLNGKILPWLQSSFPLEMKSVVVDLHRPPVDGLKRYTIALLRQCIDNSMHCI
jgi:hypothetical protein